MLGLSANSQGMLPRAHGAQYMMFTILEVFVDYPSPISVTYVQGKQIITGF